MHAPTSLHHSGTFENLTFRSSSNPEQKNPVKEESASVTVAKVVKLAPPILTPETVQAQVICTRPMREGKFNISLEHKNNKTLVHCYGHGGSGWTTLFGSVNKAVQLFIDTNPDKAVPVRVIGSGCMGLTMAIELKRLGFQVSISTKNAADIPSWRAAGYFALVSVQTSSEEQETLHRIGIDTFRAYQKIGEGKHPYIRKEAVRFMPVYCSEDTESGVEDLEAKGEIPPREKVTLDFGTVKHENYVKFMTYFMNTAILRTQLQNQIELLSIPMTVETIDSFDKIAESVVFNCTGIGARELNKDESLIPVTGHLHLFNAKAGQGHMDYMIYTKVQQGGKNEYIYLFPKEAPESPDGAICKGALGGTFIKHVDKLSSEEQEALHQREFIKMQERASQFFYGQPYKV